MNKCISHLKNKRVDKPTKCILHEPLKHSLTDCLKELKFGRPRKAQKLIDNFIRDAEFYLGE